MKKFWTWLKTAREKIASAWLSTKRKKYALAWILWILAFGLIEWRAIVDDDKEEGDFTLSHYVRRLLGEKGTAITAGKWAFRVGLAGLFIWMIPHFFEVIF